MKIVEQGVYYITQKPENNVTMLQDFDTKFGWENTHDRVNVIRNNINPFDFSSRFKNMQTTEVVAKEYVRVVSTENKTKLDDLREKYVQSRARQKHVLKTSKKSIIMSAFSSVILLLVMFLYIKLYINKDSAIMLNFKGGVYALSALIAIIPLAITSVICVFIPKYQSKKHLKSAKNILKQDNLIENEFLTKDNISLSMLTHTKVVNFKGDVFYVPAGINKLDVKELPIYTEDNMLNKVKFYKYFYVPSTVKHIDGEFEMSPTNMWPIGMIIFESDDVILSEELQQQIMQKMINVVFSIPKSSVSKLIKNIYL